MAETRDFSADNLFNVKGFVAVVTGGGSGIGLMATQALAANGARVYITGRRVEALEKAAKEHQPASGEGQIIPFGPYDVTKKEDLGRLVEAISEKEKCIHLLVCSAGISGPKAEPKDEDAEDLRARLWENEDVDDWQNNYQTNVTAVYFTTVAFLPLLQAASTQLSKPCSYSFSVTPKPLSRLLLYHMSRTRFRSSYHPLLGQRKLTP